MEQQNNICTLTDYSNIII